MKVLKAYCSNEYPRKMFAVNFEQRMMEVKQAHKYLFYGKHTRLVILVQTQIPLASRIRIAETCKDFNNLARRHTFYWEATFFSQRRQGRESRN